MKIADFDFPPKKIWIVFTGKTDIQWLKILKPGFRHCFAILNDGQKWMSVDPLAPYTDINIYHHIEPDFDLVNALRAKGYQVIKAPTKESHKSAAPIMVFTCVEAIKRLIGLHARHIITPWQLYRHLTQIQNNQFN